MALTVDKIVDRLVTQYKLQRREAVDLVDTFFDDIKKQIEKGNRVKLVNFGSFYMAQRGHRKRRNIPVTEDTPRWRLPSLHSAVAFRRRIQRAQIEVERDVD